MEKQTNKKNQTNKKQKYGMGTKIDAWLNGTEWWAQKQTHAYMVN